MQLSVSTAALRPLPLTEAIRRLVDAGWTSIELALPAGEDGRPRLWTDEELAEALAWCMTYGVRPRSLHLDLDWSAEPAMFKQFGAAAMAASFAGATHLAMLPGTGAEPQGEAMDAVLKLADDVVPFGLQLLLRPGPGWCQDYRAMLTSHSLLAHEAIRVEFDPGTYQLLNEGTDGEVAVQRIWGLVGGLRLGDTDADRRRWELFAPGQGGRVDFARLWQIVGPLRFSGPVVLDMRRRKRLSPDETLEQLDEGRRFLEMCGWRFESKE